MTKKAVCFALGGHIANQNISFQKLRQLLPEYEFYGAINGFEAFNTRQVQNLNVGLFPSEFAGSIFGAGRFSLKNKDGSLNEERVEKAVEFFRKGNFDIAVGSGGDDHGVQMSLLEKILRENRGKIGRDVDVFVINKTMDNDLGGEKGITDFTNGFHTAASVGINEFKNHFSGAWTNNCPYLIGLFGRETNWVGATVSYFGNADRFLYGELPPEHQGHSIERVHDLIVESQDENEKKYGKRFAMITVAEGTRISGIEHEDSSIIDEHGHHKLNPEVLVVELKRSLEERFKLKTQTLGITYEMRNSPPTIRDMKYGTLSAEVIAKAIRQGASGYESVFKFQDDSVVANIAPIIEVSQKRYLESYPKQVIDKEALKVKEEIGRYYGPLFGKKQALESWLPSKPVVVQI